jgi:hypothetical protein
MKKTHEYLTDQYQKNKSGMLCVRKMRGATGFFTFPLPPLYFCFLFQENYPFEIVSRYTEIRFGP